MSRLDEQLRKSGEEFTVVWHCPASTAPRRAKFLGETGARVAKSLLVITNRCPVIVLAPASHRVEFEALRKVMGVSEARMATMGEIRQLLPDCDYGQIPGFGIPYQIPTVIADPFLRQPYLLAPSPRNHQDIRISVEGYRRIEQPLHGTFSRRQPAEPSDSTRERKLHPRFPRHSV